MAGKGKNQFVENLKKGFEDIQVVLQEGTVKLFAKQIVVIVLMFFVLRYANGKFEEKNAAARKQISAIDIQKKSEQDYMDSKNKLISLEPQFPDIEQKNEWLLSHILGFYKEANVTPQMEGGQAESDANPSYLLTTQKVGATMSYIQLGKFLEMIENAKDYVRISSVDIVKNTSPESVGENKVSMIFNTIFPKEKVGAKLFSNYNELVEQQRSKEDNQ